MREGFAVLHQGFAYYTQFQDSIREVLIPQPIAHEYLCTLLIIDRQKIGHFGNHDTDQLLKHGPKIIRGVIVDQVTLQLHGLLHVLWTVAGVVYDVDFYQFLA